VDLCKFEVSQDYIAGPHFKGNVRKGPFYINVVHGRSWSSDYRKSENTYKFSNKSFNLKERGLRTDENSKGFRLFINRENQTLFLEFWQGPNVLIMRIVFYFIPMV